MTTVFLCAADGEVEGVITLVDVEASGGDGVAPLGLVAAALVGCLGSVC